jgi:signal transduction histidine kinase
MGTEVAELEEKIRRLERINDQKDHLLAILGHELRNPLAAIRSAAEVLRLTLGGEARVQKTYAILERQTMQMVRLLDRLTDVSRLARGKLVLERTRVDLASILQATLDRAAAEQKSLLLEAEVPLGSLWVEGDPPRLAQIFDNLVSNAIKFGASGGVIHVRARRSETSAVVEIEDCGEGIPLQSLPNIFDMLEPGSHGSPRLGLALVKGLAELHGGSVSARSEGPGRGASFELRLPLAP